MRSNAMVSIITPCYNGEKYLLPFFESILAQTYQNIELFFVDDGSTDNTGQIAQAYGRKLQERGIKFFYIFQENRGQAAAINRGLNLFSGEYLMWFDADDILCENHIERKVEYLENHPECGFVLAQGETVNHQDIHTRTGLLKRQSPDAEDHLFEDLIYERNIVYGPGTIMVRAAVLLQAIPSRHIFESKQGQNWQLMLPIAYTARCGYLDEVLFKCVEHPDSHSRMYRNYDAQVRRQQGFEELLTYTVNQISQMSQEDKAEWCTKIAIKHTRNRLQLAYRAIKVRDMREMRARLESLGYGLKASDSFSWFWFRCIFKKIVSKIR